MSLLNIYNALLLFGLLIFFLAVWRYQNTKSLLKKGNIVNSTVIRIEKTRSKKKKKYMYTPVYQYSDQLGVKHEYKRPFRSSPALNKIGDTVPLVYDLEDVKNVKVRSFWGLYRWTIILMCLAAPFLIIGGCHYLFERGYW